MTISLLDCTHCGACCLTSNPRYVALLPEDADRALPADAVIVEDGRRFMRIEAGRCACLRRLPEGRLACGVYEARPTACRAFRAGSFECLMARKHRGEAAGRLRLGLTGRQQPKPVPGMMPPALPWLLAPRLGRLSV